MDEHPRNLALSCVEYDTVDYDVKVGFVAIGLITKPVPRTKRLENSCIVVEYLFAVVSCDTVTLTSLLTTLLGK